MLLKVVRNVDLVVRHLQVRMALCWDDSLMLTIVIIVDDLWLVGKRLLWEGCSASHTTVLDNTTVLY